MQESSQDSLQDDSFVSSAGPDQFSDTGLFSGSDSDTQPPPTPCWDQEHQVAPSSSSSPFHLSQGAGAGDSSSALDSAPFGSDGLRPAVDQEEEEGVVEEEKERKEEKEEAKELEKESVCSGSGAPPPTTLSGKLSSDSLQVSLGQEVVLSLKVHLPSPLPLKDVCCC